MRTPKEIIESHLNLRKENQFERDLEENYSPDIVLIDAYTIYRGFDGMRESYKVLQASLPDAVFTYKRVVVERNVGYLIWEARGKDVEVKNGVDTFLIEDGKITIQTVFYETIRI